MDDLKAHDGKFLTKQIHPVYLERSLLIAPLDFSAAQDMSADDVDEWLADHSLQAGWSRHAERYRPLALFVDEHEGDGQREIREFLCVDVSHAQRPVALFVREGVVRELSPSLETFLTQLSATEVADVEAVTDAPVADALNARIDAARELRLSKQYDAALLALNECLTLEGIDRKRVLRERAWTHHALGNLADALVDADAITQPDDALALAYRGELHFALGDFLGAKDDLERALALGLRGAAAKKLQEMLQDISTR